jgi:hypothetical protein
MADQTYTVDPGGSKTYSSLSAWEAAVQTSHTSGDTATAECYRTTSAKDTTLLQIHGWTAGVIPKVTVHADHRHEGKEADQQAGGNYIATLEVNGTCINNFLTAVTPIIEWLRIINTSTTTSTYCISSCLHGDKLICVTTNTSASAVYMTTNGTLRNTVLFGSGGGRGVYASGAATGITVYNCTGYDWYRAFDVTSVNWTVTNCGGFGCSNADFGGSTPSGDKNVSSDTSAPGTTVATNQTSYSTYFTDHTNGDFHLKDTGNNLWSISGNDLSGTFTDDIDGDTRSNWDVGADEYISAVTSKPNLLLLGAG